MKSKVNRNTWCTAAIRVIENSAGQRRTDFPPSLLACRQTQQEPILRPSECRLFARQLTMDMARETVGPLVARTPAPSLPRLAAMDDRGIAKETDVGITFEPGGQRCANLHASADALRGPTRVHRATIGVQRRPVLSARVCSGSL
jgi:hypothetical protein